jgi:hypothetical protein
MNIGINVGDVVDAYGCCPPPSVGGISVRRGLRKAGKGLSKAGKGVRWVGKKIAYAAAAPVRLMFKKFGMRRARLLAWQRRQSSKPNAAEKKEAAAWTLAKIRAKRGIGPVAAKILTATTSATLGGATLGMTGAEIAAVATAAAAAINHVMQSMNKAGLAPANPMSAEREE